MQGLRSIDLKDSDWGTVPIKLLAILPQEDNPWGIAAPLQGTPWGDQIQKVSGEAFSHALHGWAMPLMREIGVDPYIHAKKVPIYCDLKGSCIGFNTKNCLPGKLTPNCYQVEENSDLITTIVLAWKEGRYVILIEGAEFSLR